MKYKNPLAFQHIEKLQNTTRTGNFTDYHVVGSDGMTLLDYFAGQALMGVIANPKVEEMRIAEFDDKYSNEQQTEAIVIFCYQTAEAMLKERDKRMKDAG